MQHQKVVYEAFAGRRSVGVTGGHRPSAESPEPWDTFQYPGP